MTQNRIDVRPRALTGPAAHMRAAGVAHTAVKTPSTPGFTQKMKKTPTPAAPLMRSEIGDVLRTLRQNQHRTLREVSSQAQVSLGYLSEVERGQKEASSELLEAITGALRVPLWYVLREVSDRMAVIDGATIPDTVPDDLLGLELMS